MNVVWRTLPLQREIFPAVLSFFSALRAYRPGVIQELRQKRVSIETVVGWLKAIRDPWYAVWAEAALIHAFCDNEELPPSFEKLRNKHPASARSEPRYRANGLAEHLSRNGFAQEMLFILSQLEMSEGFH
jgi:hypothetical protein